MRRPCSNAPIETPDCCLWESGPARNYILHWTSCGITFDGRAGLQWEFSFSSVKRRLRSLSIEEDAATNVPTNSLPELPYIEETIEHGGISVGIIPPLKECIAVAHEGRHTLAMPKRQNGESLAQRLSRLDLDIALAHTEEVFTDEINPANTKRS